MYSDILFWQPVSDNVEIIQFYSQIKNIGNNRLEFILQFFDQHKIDIFINTKDLENHAVVKHFHLVFLLMVKTWVSKFKQGRAKTIKDPATGRTRSDNTRKKRKSIILPQKSADKNRLRQR